MTFIPNGNELTNIPLARGPPQITTMEITSEEVIKVVKTRTYFFVNFFTLF